MIERRPFYKKIWFWLLAFFIGFPLFLIITGVVIRAVVDIDSVEPTTETTVPVIKEKPEKEEKKEVKKVVFDKKKVFENEVMPWRDKIISKYDSVWELNWTKTMNGFSTDKIDESIVKEKMVILDEEYYSLTEEIDGFKIPEGFSKEEKKQIVSFKDNMNLAIDNRISASLEVTMMFEGKLPIDTEFATENIERSDKYMIKGLADIIQLGTDLGIKE